MTLLSRISRLFRADFHALLDSLEEPEVLLRQALREMEEQLCGDEQCEKRWEAGLERLNGLRNDLQKNLVDLAAELDLCFTADREPLARNLIKRRLQAERGSERLSQQIAALEKSLKDLRGRLQDQRERLDALRQKAALFDEAQVSPHSLGDGPITLPAVSDDEIEIALLREKQRRMPS